ncbi:MAG: putative lipid II flippase FtsW [Sediminispirochaetaceae bacterium]
MSDMFNIERVHRNGNDMTLLLLLILIVGVGMTTLFSASYYYGGKRFDDPFFFFNRQALFAVVGGVLALIVSRLPMEFIQKRLPLLLTVSFLLMAATFVPGIKQSIMGANRWIIVAGVSFQPSELVKLTLILYLSAILSKKADKLDDVINSILPPLLIVVIFTSLIYLQNDFSTAFFVIMLSLLIFFVAGIRIRYFVFLFAMIVPLAAMLIFTKEHRVRRLIAFIDPNSDPIGTGYQVIAAKDAIAAGSFWGRGFGMGTEKLGGLPEAHSDFIFAVFAEELGFMGVLFIVALFIAFALKGYSLALSYASRNRFEFLLSFGLTSCLVFQAFINMAVVAGMLPATGLPLPFFSHGGSSMVITMIMAGLLLNLSRGRMEMETGRNYE